jgi:16S rRNA (adenine(1408)-N(1))-methyltransferase
VAARSDNSPEKNLSSLSTPTGEGVVIDIGTGDGRFVSAQAEANPDKFYIGIDANVKPLEKPSMKATRRLNKGGLLNALFVQAAAEDLPEELNGIADEIHIHFPWGSLLQAITVGDEAILASLRRISAPGCLLEIVVGTDPIRDKTEIERLKIPDLTVDYLRSHLSTRFSSVGFEPIKIDQIEKVEWSKMETSWARKLGSGDFRKVFCLVFRFKS